MILQEYLCSLRDALIDQGLVNTFHEFCEQIQRDGVTYPAYYDKGGEYVLVHDFDTNGNGYIRKRGTVSLQPSRETSFTACKDDNDYILMTYPLRLVMGVPKDKLNDNAYSDDQLFFNIADIIGTGYSVTNVQDTSVTLRSYNTDALSIWSQEVRGVDYQMLFRLSYISIDFDVTFTVRKSCLKEICAYGVYN